MKNKIIGLTFFVCGFTFISQGVALNSLTTVLPSGFTAALQLFMILAFLSGLGFLVAGGLFFFGGEKADEIDKSKICQIVSRADETKTKSEMQRAEKQPETMPMVSLREKESEPIPKEKTDKEKKDWESPSQTGWG